MPQLFRTWDRPELVNDWRELQSLYESGLSGCTLDPKVREAERERFRSEMPNPDGEEVCRSFGMEEAGKGKLVATWTFVERAYPGCWPAAAQRRGDCVSHSQRNAMLTTLVGEAVAGLPDEVTGLVEECPSVSPEAQRDGVLATEAIYRHRGSRGDGWFCLAAARVAVQTTGAVLRKNYPGHADLTRYNPSWAGGAATASERDVFDDNRFREATELRSFEAIRDMLARGFGVSSCGSEGFSSTRNEDGVSRRQGSWPHAMAYGGADDRNGTHAKYGGPLVLVLNSWGPRWNSGPRTVRDTDGLLIPEGSFWAKWSDLSRRSHVATGGLNGWQRKNLPDYLGGWQ